MQLEECFDYKNQLMYDILTNETIVKLINDQYDLKSAKELVYKQVFPYEYIPETVYNGQTFVTFDVEVQNSSMSTKTFYKPTLYIWVFSHMSNLRMPNGGGVRTDKICSEICKVINGSRYYGLGEMNLYSVRRYAPMTDYNGKQMTFTMNEFMKVYDGKRKVPSNRKAGV